MLGLFEAGRVLAVGRCALSLVAFVELCPLTQGWPGKEASSLLGGVIMTACGWYGTPAESRRPELNEIGPWVVGVVVLTAGVRLAAILVAK